MADKEAIMQTHHEKMDNAEEQEKEPLVKVTARIASNVSKIIKELAEEYDVSFSEVVRLSIDGHLEKYLGGVQYVDKDQAEIMFRQRMEIVNGIQTVWNELHRIGINVNQIAKCNNISAQIVQLKEEASRTGDSTERSLLLERIKKLEDFQSMMEFTDFDRMKFEKCMEQFKESSKLMGRILWRIPW